MLVNDSDGLIVHIIHVWKHWNSFTFQLMKHELFIKNEAGGVSLNCARAQPPIYDSCTTGRHKAAR